MDYKNLAGLYIMAFHNILEDWAVQFGARYKMIGGDKVTDEMAYTNRALAKRLEMKKASDEYGELSEDDKEKLLVDAEQVFVDSLDLDEIFVPKDWELIYYKEPEIRSITIGQMIDDRLNADVKIGFASKREIYTIDCEPELEQEIRDRLAYSYKDNDYDVLLVKTADENIVYRFTALFGESDECVWLALEGDYQLES